MKLDIFCVLIIGYFMRGSDAADKDKNVHVKVHAPELIQQHSHQHTIHKKSPNDYDENEHNDDNGGRNAPLVVHNHQYSPEDGYTHKHKFVYNPEKKQKVKHKKASNKKDKKQKRKKYGDDQDFKQILKNYDVKPEKSDEFGIDDGFKKSFHTEHYEVKKINPNARFPDEKYIIEGAYKVQETDPWGYPTTSFHKYDSPISKIAASILSKYDYTNFRPGESDDYHKEKEEDRDHDNIEYGGNDDSYNYGNNKKKTEGYNNPSSTDPETSKYNTEDYDYSPRYDNSGQQKKAQDHNYGAPKVHSNGKDYEQSAGYEDFLNKKKAHYTAPFNYGPVQQSHEDLHSKARDYENKNQKSQGYSTPEIHINLKPDDKKIIGHLKQRPVEIEYVIPHDHDAVERELEYEFEKEFGHLTHPGHTVGPGYHYDNDYEKHLIEHIYGQDHAATNKFVQKVRPYNARRA